MYALPVVILLAFLIAPVAQAEEAWQPKTSRGRVMAYECAQIDARVNGFTCHFNKGELRLQLHVKDEELDRNPERKRQVYYALDKITLRYFELGGRGYTVGSDHWPAGRVRECARAAKRPHSLAAYCHEYDE
jgi:hypothetical protein